MTQVYKVIAETDMITFQREVNSYLSAGWRLNGGMTVTIQHTTSRYFQSLYKEVSND